MHCVGMNHQGRHTAVDFAVQDMSGRCPVEPGNGVVNLPACDGNVDSQQQGRNKEAGVGSGITGNCISGGTDRVFIFLLIGFNCCQGFFNIMVFLVFILNL